MRVIEGESDNELSGDEEGERQGVEQVDEYSEENISAEEEPEEEILTPNYWPHEQHVSNVKQQKELDCQHHPVFL